MTNYTPTAAVDLLRAEKDGITLADYLESAIGNAVRDFTEDDQLAVFALADDLLDTLLPAFANLNMADYEMEETAPEVAPSETAKSVLEDGSVSTVYLSRSKDNTGHAYGTWSGEPIPHKGHAVVIVDIDTVAQMMDDGPQLLMVNPACVAAHDTYLQHLREKEQAEEKQRLRSHLRQRIEDEVFREELDVLEEQVAAIYERIDSFVDERLAARGVDL